MVKIDWRRFSVGQLLGESIVHAVKISLRQPATRESIDLGVMRRPLSAISPHHRNMANTHKSNLPSLKLTASLPLKMDGWNTIRLPIGANLAYFQG